MAKWQNALEGMEGRVNKTALGTHGQTVEYTKFGDSWCTLVDGSSILSHSGGTFIFNVFSILPAMI